MPLPGSKSLTNRELLLAALATGPGQIRAALRSRDTELMARALTALGSPVSSDDEDWSVVPGIGAEADAGSAEVDCGLAGTVMRFVPAAAALRDGTTRFDGDPHARTRPMGSILNSLSTLGVSIDAPTKALPFTVQGTGSVGGGALILDASASSQFVSALLLAAPRFDQGLDLRHVGPPMPSLPHVQMTVASLRARGVTVDDSEPDRWQVTPGPIAARDVVIEPDLSNAAPFLMLALTAGGSVTVPHWPAVTTQAGNALRDLLAAMGAQVEWSSAGLTVTGTGEIHGLEADLRDVGELTPALAALAALADTPSHLYGVAHIRGHETDRLAALATELRALGGEVTETEDGLRISPAPLHGGVFRTYADHRMAHAAVILGSRVPGVIVENVATTSKTFPGFEHAWAALLGTTGAEVS